MPDAPTMITVATENGIALVRAAPGFRSGPRDVADDSTPAKLSQAVATIRSVAGEMVEAVEGLSVSRATIEFGVSFTVRSGQLVAAFVDAGQECSFAVTLEWTPRG